MSTILINTTLNKHHVEVRRGREAVVRCTCSGRRRRRASPWRRASWSACYTRPRLHTGAVPSVRVSSAGCGRRAGRRRVRATRGARPASRRTPAPPAPPDCRRPTRRTPAAGSRRWNGARGADAAACGCRTGARDAAARGAPSSRPSRSVRRRRRSGARAGSQASCGRRPRRSRRRCRADRTTCRRRATHVSSVWTNTAKDSS